MFPLANPGPVVAQVAQAQLEADALQIHRSVQRPDEARGAPGRQQSRMRRCTGGVLRRRGTRKTGPAPCLRCSHAARGKPLLDDVGALPRTNRPGRLVHHPRAKYRAGQAAQRKQRWMTGGIGALWMTSRQWGLVCPHLLRASTNLLSRGLPEKCVHPLLARGPRLSRELEHAQGPDEAVHARSKIRC